jgi:Fe2+ or Zn2+ uptake regulation protein
LSGLHLALAKNRSTRQRGAIGAVIDIVGWPPIPQEMQKMVLTEVPTLSLATVYRNLQKLIDNGEITAVSHFGDSSCAESTALVHHHHCQYALRMRVFHAEATQPT